MPGANAPFLFSKFIEGYMGGSRQANQDRYERAHGLMDYAAQQAKIADSSENPQARALAYKSVKDLMGQANKLLKEDVGMWGMISKLFGKGGKDDLQDPREQLAGLGVAPYGYENKSIQHPGTPQGAQAEQPKIAPQDQPAGIASMISGAQEMPAPKPVEGPVGPMAQAAPAPVQTPVSDTIPYGVMPQPRPVTTQVPIQRRTEVGYKHPDEATGKGAERVQLGPELYDLRIDGVSVSPEHYRGFVTRMAERDIDRKYAAQDREAGLAAQKELATWQVNFEQETRDKRSQAFAQTEIGRRMQAEDPDQFNDIMTHMQTGVMPKDRPVTIVTSSIQDPATGHRVKRTVDRRTGKLVIPDEAEAPSAWDQKVILYIKSGRARSVAEAETMLAKEYMRDERVTNALRDLQLEKSAESIEAMQQLKALRQRKLDVKDPEAVKKILAVCQHAADVQVAASQGMMGSDQYMALVISLLQTYGGMDWNQARTALGAAGLSDFYEDQSKGYAAAIQKTPPGGLGRPAGVIQPGITGMGGASAGGEAVIPGKTPGVYTPKR